MVARPLVLGLMEAKIQRDEAIQTILYQKNYSKASKMLQADFVRVLQTWGAKWCCVDSIFSKTRQAAEFPGGNQDPC